jgi:hypothetical protein
MQVIYNDEKSLNKIRTI